jgi:hypothetical protein
MGHDHQNVSLVPGVRRTVIRAVRIRISRTLGTKHWNIQDDGCKDDAEPGYSGGVRTLHDVCSPRNRGWVRKLVRIAGRDAAEARDLTANQEPMNGFGPNRTRPSKKQN